jgi:hypothetical protein
MTASRKQLRDEWLKALESGGYKQGQQALCQKSSEGNRYCCLGVATEIFRRHNPGVLKKVWQHQGGGDVMALYKSESDEDSGVLLSEVKKAFGFRSETGEFRNSILATQAGRDYRAWSLVDLNDSGVGFKTIAQVVREHPNDIFIIED